MVAVGFGDRIVIGVFGEAFQPAARVFVLLCVALIAMAANGALNNLLIAAFHQRVVTLNALILSGLNIVVNVALIPILGAVGAAIATVIVEFSLLAMSLFWLSRFGFSVMRDLAPAALIAAGPVVSTALALQMPGLRIPFSIVGATWMIVAAVKTGTITPSTPRSILTLFVGLRQPGSVRDPT